MTSTFVNNLALNEMATGDQSGSWGTVTNLNLELIGEGLGFATEAPFNTDGNKITTVAPGASDPARAMYFKVTSTVSGGLTATRQLTIDPDTINRLMFIENATTGGESITIKQGSGSGAAVTIPNGDTKAVILSGSGSGSIVLDAFASLSVVDLNVSGAVQIDNTLSVGVDDTGYDVKFFGATASAFMQWDASADDLILGGAAGLSVNSAALVTGVLTTTAAAVFNGGFTSFGDDVIFTSANADDPLVTIRQTGNNASSSRLYFIKDKGAAGADGDEIGKIEFIADNSAQEQISFAKIQATISESADTDEAGKLEFLVAESSGSANQLTVGLLIEGEHATDGEVDVTIAAGANSTTTVAGDLAVTTDATVGGTLGVTGVVTANAGVVVDEMTLDADTLTATDDFILDVEGDIDLNTNSGLITLKDDNVHFGSLFNSSSDLFIASTTQDKDIKFQGMDGNTTLFTMLQLDASDAGAARFKDGTASLPSISNLDDTNTGMYFPAADTIAFAEGGNEIFKLDSSGNVGIKKDNTAIDTRFHIDQCPDNKVITFEQSGRKMAMGTFFSSGSTASRLDFFLSDGNQNGGNNNKMSILSGGGITFNGDTAAANALDDYEEGTWTPVVQVGFANPGHAVQYGHYTRIGDQVIAFFKLKMDAGTPNSERLRVGGLPYSSFNDGNQTPIAQPMVLVSASKGNSMFVLQVANSTVMEFYEQNATNIGSVIGTHVGNTFDVIATMIYEVA